MPVITPTRTRLSISRSIRARRAAATALRALAATAAACGAVSPAGAHGFGQRYDLPLPLSLYLTGTAAAVVVSFLIVGLFVREAPPARARPRADLRATALGRWIGRPGLAAALKLAAFILFAVTVLAGVIGNPDPYRNIAPTMVWIIFWVGFAYVSAFVGNLWPLINPWRTLFQAAEWPSRRILGRGLALDLPFPESLGVWPAFVLLLGFSWLELVYPAPAVPANIAAFALGYSILTFAGMIAFGEAWLRHGEVFTLVFGILARFAPLQPTEQNARWTLRAPGAGLIDAAGASTSMMALVLLILSSVLYDGALGTPEWSTVENALATHLPGWGDAAFLLIRTIGLAAFWLVFFGAYLAVSFAMRVAVNGQLQGAEIARAFALTLVPIAIGYHLAHYLTYLLVQGQYIIPLASDPFGYGWNLFGTAGYRVDIGMIGARFAWYAAVAAILLGHIAAVYLAHVKALQLLPSRRAALRSQVPLTALMVVYTFVSLSILAEPIAEYRSAPALPLEASTAPIAVPEDAVLPELGSGRLQAVGPGKVARQKLTYRMLGSAFHDGTKTSAADILYAFMFAYRWGSPGAGEEAHYDPAIDAATAVMRARLAGLRLVGVDTSSKSIRFGDFEYVRELLVVDVYTTTPPIDPEQDAIVAPPWSTLPWHLLVLMEEAVNRGYAAFSQQEAARRGVEWLDLVRSDTLKPKLEALVETFARDGYRPAILAPLVSAEEARKRWTALSAFYKAHGHFLVTNGPYRLQSWSGTGAVLDVFRDLSYPLGVGSFDNYAIPRRGYVTKVERQDDRMTLFGDIELVMKYQRSYDILRQPLQSVAPDVVKRSAPQLRYLVTDAEGRAVLVGQADFGDDLAFHLDLTGRLPPGRFTLAAEIAVNGNVMNAEIKRVPIVMP
jgi:hypothetical protein